jgi:hypothetical protein
VIVNGAANKRRRLAPSHLTSSGYTTWWVGSQVDLFRYGKGVIDLSAEISDGTLDLGMAEQKLHES